MENSKGNTLTIVLVAFLIALVFGAGGYLLGTRSQKADDSAATTPSSSTDKTTSTTKKSTSSEIPSDWKTYTNNEIGFTMRYPSDWTEPVLNKQENVAGKPGFTYSTSTNKGPLDFDPDKVFSIYTQSKDYVSFIPLTQQPPKAIDVNWTKEQYKQNEAIDGGEVLLYKKLSPKSALLSIFSAPEASPGVRLSVIRALNSNYPNIEIGVVSGGVGGLSDDPAVAAALKNYNGDETEILAVYQGIMNKIAAGTYSDKIAGYIKTAQMVSDSITPTK